MSLSSTARVQQYAGNGATTIFAYPYRYFLTSDIIVVFTVAGVDTQQFAGFTVSTANLVGGGNITFSVAPPVGTTVTFYTAAPQTQSVDYITDDNFPAETHEQALDRLTVLVQQLQVRVDRSLRIDLTSAVFNPFALNARKGNVVGFDTNGNPTLYVITGGVVSLQSITGTANQVLVNGAAGVPTSGAVTLTLPQSIALTSAPQFAGMTLQAATPYLLYRDTSGGAGITTGGLMRYIGGGDGTWYLQYNTAAGADFSSSVNIARWSVNGAQILKLGVGVAPPTVNGTVIIGHTQASVTAQACVLVQGALTPGPGTDLHPNAFRDTTVFTANVAADAYCSYDCNATLTGSVALNHYRGYQARQGFAGGAGVLDVYAGFVCQMGVNSGTVTEMRGFYVADQIISGGTVGHFAGLYMDALTTGTTRHAIYIAGANDIFMAGGQFGNSALLTFPAGATTCRGYFTFNQTSQTGLAIMNSNATATGVLVSFCNNGGTVQGTISQTNSTTVAYNTSSDARLKENVRSFDGEDVGKMVDLLQPVVYDWKWGGKNYHGFIAQDVQLIYPEAVTVGFDDEETPEQSRPWQMDKTQLIPLLTAEIKSLRARVKLLEAA